VFLVIGTPWLLFGRKVTRDSGAVDSQKERLPWNLPFPLYFFALLLLIGMLLLLEIGRRYGVRPASERVGRRAGRSWHGRGRGFRPVWLDGSVHLLGSGNPVLTRKRMLTAEEVNCIETAYLRLQLLSHDAQACTSGIVFAAMWDSRLETYRRLPNMVAAEMEMAESKKIQEEVWNEAVAATRLSDSHPSAGLFAASRAKQHDRHLYHPHQWRYKLHPPRIVYALLFGLGLICSLLAGVLGCRVVNTRRLAAYPRFHTPYGHHRLRHARRRVPTRGFNPP